MPTPTEGTTGLPQPFKGLRAGDLRQLITIQKRLNLPQDAAGQLTSDWIDFKTVRACVEPLDGRELELAGRLVAEVNYQVKIWYISGLDPSMKVKAGWGKDAAGPELDIKAVIDPEMRHRRLTLLCKSGVPEA